MSEANRETAVQPQDRRLRRLLLNGVSHVSLAWAELNRGAREAPQGGIAALGKHGLAVPWRN